VQNRVMRSSKRYWAILIAWFNLIPCLCHAEDATQCKSVKEVVEILEDTDWVPQNLELLVTVHGTQYDRAFRKTEKIDDVSTVSICDGIAYWNTSDLKGTLKKKERVILTPEIVYQIKPDNSYTTSSAGSLSTAMYSNPIKLTQFMVGVRSARNNRILTADFIAEEAKSNDVITSCIGEGKILVSANYDTTTQTLLGHPVKIQNNWEVVVSPNAAGNVLGFSRRSYFSPVEQVFQCNVRKEADYKGFHYPSVLEIRDGEIIGGKTHSEVKGTVYIQVLKTGDEVAPIDVAAILNET